MMLDADQRPGDDRRGIQSIEVGFRLIRTLAQAPGKMTLKALAGEAGMSSSKAHLYLVSFQRLGLVVQDSATTRYGLGPSAIELGLAAINQQDVVEAGRDEMAALVEAHGISVSLSVWGNRGATIIFRLDGRWPVPLSVKVGFVLPLLSTATGRIFLTHLPEREWRPIAEVEEDIDPGRLDRTLAMVPQIRSRGLAFTDGEMNRGFVGISAPVFDATGGLCAALTGLGLTSQPGLRPDGPVGAGIATAANRISRAIGWQG